MEDALRTPPTTCGLVISQAPVLACANATRILTSCYAISTIATKICIRSPQQAGVHAPAGFVLGLPLGLRTKPFAPGRLYLLASALAALRIRAGSMGCWQWGQFMCLLPRLNRPIRGLAWGDSWVPRGVPMIIHARASIAISIERMLGLGIWDEPDHVSALANIGLRHP